jgi:hypothetical protein
MKTIKYSILTLFFYQVILGSPALVFSEANMTDLQQKMAAISLLQNQLNQRKTKAIEIREKLYGHLSTLGSEVKIISAQKKITTFKDAQAHPRVLHNLQLYGEVHSYIDQINQKIRYYQIGLDKLDYLYQSADDHLKIINTLTHLKIEALLTQIDMVIQTYLPEAHRILISLDNLDISDATTVWNQMIRGAS